MLKMANKRTVFIEFYTNYIIQKDSIKSFRKRRNYKIISRNNI